MVEPSVWGPPLWKTIHFVALGYPDVPSETDVRNFKRFFESLEHVIPCAVPCAVNYGRHLKEIPIEPYLRMGRTALFEWTITLHNIVNAENGKAVIDPKKALAYYMKEAGGHSSSSSSASSASSPCLSPTCADKQGVNLIALLAVATIMGVAGALVTYVIMRKGKR